MLYFKAVLEFFDFRVVAKALTDSSAARGIIKREGVGRIKHLSTRMLWAQQVVKTKKVLVSAVATKDNKADLGTKSLSGPRLRLLRKACGLLSLEEAKAAGQTAQVATVVSRVPDVDAQMLKRLVSWIVAAYAAEAANGQEMEALSRCEVFKLQEDRSKSVVFYSSLAMLLLGAVVLLTTAIWSAYWAGGARMAPDQLKAVQVRKVN